MSILLDTCIIVDYIRAREEARNYIHSIEDYPYLSVVTVTELLTGIRNKREREIVGNIIDNSIILEVNQEIATIAGHLLNQYFKSHSVGLGDGLIAATAQFHDLEVATVNIKHFPMFPDIKKPYSYTS